MCHASTLTTIQVASECSTADTPQDEIDEESQTWPSGKSSACLTELATPTPDSLQRACLNIGKGTCTANAHCGSSSVSTHPDAVHLYCACQCGPPCSISMSIERFQFPRCLELLAAEAGDGSNRLGRGLGLQQRGGPRLGGWTGQALLPPVGTVKRPTVPCPGRKLRDVDLGDP